MASVPTNRLVDVPNSNGSIVIPVQFYLDRFPYYQDLFKGTNTPLYDLLSKTGGYFLMRQAKECQLLEVDTPWSWEEIKGAEVKDGKGLRFEKSYPLKKGEDLGPALFTETEFCEVGGMIGKLVGEFIDPGTERINYYQPESILADHPDIIDYFDGIIDNSIHDEPYVYHAHLDLSGTAQNLKNMCFLRNILTPAHPRFSDCDIDGITKVYIYVSKRNTLARLHLEDYGLSSINIQFKGDSKAVFIIDPEPRNRILFESKYRELWKIPPDEIICPANLQSRRGVVHLRTIDNWGVRWLLMLLNPGDIAYFGPQTWHFVINLGCSVNGAVNVICNKYWATDEKTCVEGICPRYGDNPHQENPDLSKKFRRAESKWIKHVVNESPDIEYDSIFKGLLNNLEKPASASSSKSVNVEENKKRLKTSKDAEEPSAPESPSSNPYECNICDESFKSQRLLQAHAKETHNLVNKVLKREFSCGSCSKVYASANKLRDHCTKMVPKHIFPDTYPSRGKYATKNKCYQEQSTQE